MDRLAGGDRFEDARVTKASPSEIVHDLRNAATSLSLAVHSLQKSAEVRSHAGRVRLRIASEELETIRLLLDDLESIERPR